MKINKLELRAFGKFRDRSVELQDGLNVLYAPNETGKSTLAGFIRYMLYGFPKNERSSASNPLTTAQRFKPWQGGEVGGSMTVTADGRRATVVREGAKSVRLYDALTMTEIPLMREPGEEFYGLSLETFESTAFFGQSALANVNIDQLEDKLKNMVTGGDEKVSYEKARDALNKAKNKIAGRAGALPMLRQEAAELALRIEQAEQERAALQELAQTCENLNARLLQAKGNATAQDEKLASERARIEKVFAGQKQDLQKQIAAAMDVQLQAQRRLGGKDRRRVDDLNGVAQRLLALRDVLGVIAQPAKPKMPIWLLIVGILILLSGVGLYFVLPMPWPLLAVLGVIPMAIYGVLVSRRKSEYERQISVYERERLRHVEASRLQEGLAAVFGEQPDYTAAISACYDDLATVAEQQGEIAKLQTKLAAMDLDHFCRDDADYGAAKRQKEQLLALIGQMEVELAQKKTRLEERNRQVGAIDEWESRFSEKQERIVALEQELAAYELAMAALDDAHLEMTHLYAPMLADRMADFFSTTTGDAERRVAVDVGGKVRVEEKDVPHSLHYYSAGTADAVYVSLRLALIDMLYARQKPTLVFDDSFANFDEGRAAEMLKLLGKLSQKTQVLYFTCRDPEPMLNGIAHHNVIL